MRTSTRVVAAATSRGGGKRPKLDSAPPKVRFQPSQFIYTLESYLKEFDTIEGNRNARPGPFISFKANSGREVIAFCPAVPVSIAATEALGRPFVEITLEQFSEFYGFDKEELKGVQKNLVNRNRLFKTLMDHHLLDSLSVNANDVFEREVQLVKKRYESLGLATWLVKDVLS